MVVNSVQCRAKLTLLLSFADEQRERLFANDMSLWTCVALLYHGLLKFCYTSLLSRCMHPHFQWQACCSDVWLIYQTR